MSLIATFHSQTLSLLRTIALLATVPLYLTAYPVLDSPAFGGGVSHSYESKEGGKTYFLTKQPYKALLSFFEDKFSDVAKELVEEVGANPIMKVIAQKVEASYDRVGNLVQVLGQYKAMHNELAEKFPQGAKALEDEKREREEESNWGF